MPLSVPGRNLWTTWTVAELGGSELDTHGDDHRFMEVLVQMISEVGEFCTVFWANLASLGNCLHRRCRDCTLPSLMFHL